MSAADLSDREGGRRLYEAKQRASFSRGMVTGYEDIYPLRWCELSPEERDGYVAEYVLQRAGGRVP